MLMSHATDFLHNVIDLVTRESEHTAKILDAQVLRADRFDTKETTAWKQQIKAQELAAATAQSTISEICGLFVQLLNSLSTYWKKTVIPQPVLDSLFTILTHPIPLSASFSHPFTMVHDSLLQFFLTGIHSASKFSEAIMRLFCEMGTSLLSKDIESVNYCASKGIVERQLMIYYANERSMRFMLFGAFLRTKPEHFMGLLEFVIGEMIPNVTTIIPDSPNDLATLRYPIRSEGLEMICFLLNKKTKTIEAAHVAAQILMTKKVVEKERQMILGNDSYTLVLSSIQYLEMLIASSGLFDQQFNETARTQREWLKSHYEGEWDPDSILAQFRETRVFLPAKRAPTRAMGETRPRTVIVAPKKTDQKTTPPVRQTLQRPSTALAGGKR
jgi:hypothetical protein